MFLLKKILPFAISFSLFAQDLELPSIVTVVSPSRNSSTTIVLDEDKLKDHKTLEEALAREGFSFKGTNNESTFHGFWNASVKVYVDQILMNDPNTGYFDWSSLDYSVIKKIVIDTASVNGCVSIYIITLYYDYTGIRYSFGVQSKSYLNSVLDSNRATAFVSSPVLLDSGSALYFSDSASVDYDQNHFGFRSKDITERTDLSKSYTGYEKAYDGYEKFLVNNSFLFEYHPCWYNGASFGFKNFISLSDANCGRESGTYYKKENQRNLNTGFSVPVFIPFEKINLKFIPSYRYSDLLYTKDAAFSSARDEYKINNFSFQNEIGILGFYKISFACSYDRSSQTSKNYSGTEENTLFTAFLNPSVDFAVGDWGFDFSTPVNYFGVSNKFDFLYKGTVSRKIRDYNFSVTALKNVTNPVFQQLYYSGGGGKGNPELKPESSLHYIFCAEYSSVFYFSVKPYLIFYKDKIGWQNSSNGLLVPLNYGSSTNYGADVSFDSLDLFGAFNLGFNYTYCRARLTSDSTVDGNQIMYTPEHTFGLTAKLKFDSFVWSNAFSYNSKKYTDNSNEYFVSEYFNLDTKLTWVHGKWETFVLWSNILDVQYTQIKEYPMPGTSVTLGVKFSN